MEQFDAVAGSETLLRARWIIRRGHDDEPLALEGSDIRVPVESDDPSDIVEAYGAAVEKLSQAIADRLRRLGQSS